MKYFIYIIIIGITFLGCDENELAENELVGTWKLIQVLADPGDGSGVFQDVTSEKTITIDIDGSADSNGRMCDLSVDTGNPSTGTFDLGLLTYSTSACNSLDIDYTFEINESELLIYIPCIEPCIAKYKKQ